LTAGKFLERMASRMGIMGLQQEAQMTEFKCQAKPKCQIP